MDVKREFKSKREGRTNQGEDWPSEPRADRFLGSFKIDKPCLRTFSERRSLSFPTRQRYSQAPPPPLSTWFSSLSNWVSSVFVTIFSKFAETRTNESKYLSLSLSVAGFRIYRWGLLCVLPSLCLKERKLWFGIDKHGLPLLAFDGPIVLIGPFWPLDCSNFDWIFILQFHRGQLPQFYWNLFLTKKFCLPKKKKKKLPVKKISFLR